MVHPNVDSREPEQEHRVLLLTLTNRDQQLTQKFLSENEIASFICSDVKHLCDEMEHGVGTIVIAEEYLVGQQSKMFLSKIEEQFIWSDLPMIILTGDGQVNEPVLERLQLRANITLLQRPSRMRYFLNAVRSKLREREHQYTVRGLLQSLSEQTQKAKEASLAKSQFLANMSHEIRTPMTAILGYAELLSNGDIDNEHADFLRIIRKNGEFLLEIINDILDLSKIEAGAVELSKTTFDFHAAIIDIQKLMQVRATENQIDLVVRISDSVPKHINSDSKRIRQILINLIGNAIKFTRVGSVNLSVDYKDTRLVLDVIDTGIGMSPAQVNQLFKPFHQADNSIAREFGGSGLGLVISQRLANMLFGEITVESELGKGSRFTFSLPVTPVTFDKQPEASPNVYRNQTFGSDEKIELDCTVLVVDDRRDIRFLSGRILSKAGAKVTYAENGLEAVGSVQSQLADGNSPDIILLDMQMPVVDGHEAARRLRKLGYTNPIVALTADAMYGDMERCLESGCTCYLGKPINSTELLNCVAGLTTH